VFNGTPFDFAVHNGVALQLVHCWSFQLTNQAELTEEVRSWAWGVHELREHGAAIDASSGVIQVPGDLDIAAVSLLPVRGQEAPAYEEVEEAFREVRVRLVPADQVDDVTAAAVDLLGAPH
jgi:hypothetical protein